MQLIQQVKYVINFNRV